MPVRDFIPERREVQAGPRRFFLRRPTVATVEMVLGLYPAEILAAVRAYREGARDVETFLVLFTMEGDERIAEVLATCTEAGGGTPVCETGEAARALVRAMLSLCDLPRILASFDFTAEEVAPLSARAVESHPEDRAFVLVGMACELGVSPLELAGWPYEAYLTAQDALLRRAGRKPVRVSAPNTIILPWGDGVPHSVN